MLKQFAHYAEILNIFECRLCLLFRLCLSKKIEKHEHLCYSKLIMDYEIKILVIVFCILIPIQYSIVVIHNYFAYVQSSSILIAYIISTYPNFFDSNENHKIIHAAYYVIPAYVALFAFIYAEDHKYIYAYTIFVLFSSNMIVYLVLKWHVCLCICYVVIAYALIAYTCKKIRNRKTYVFYKEESDTMCTICQYGLIDKVCILSCKHAYHSDCIEQWFAVKRICPNCKKIDTF